MRSRHLGRGLKRVLATVLTVVLLASDNTILYAAGAEAAAVESMEPQPERTLFFPRA